MCDPANDLPIRSFYDRGPISYRKSSLMFPKMDPKRTYQVIYLINVQIRKSEFYG